MCVYIGCPKTCMQTLRIIIMVMFIKVYSIFKIELSGIKVCILFFWYTLYNKILYNIQGGAKVVLQLFI